MISGGLNGGAVALIAAIPMLLAMFASVGAVAVLVPVLAQFLVAMMTPFLFGAGIILISLIIIALVELNRLMWTNYIKYYFEGDFSAYEEACSIAGRLGAYSLFAIDVANYLTSITAAGTVETSYGKSTLNSLKNTENFTDSAIEHIFEENIRRGTTGGYHYECIEDTAGSVIPGTEKLLNDIGVYKAQVKVNNIPKTGNGGYSTFYPKDLSPQEVIDSINEAYANRTFVKGSRNLYVGVSNRGMIIEMYINKEGKIISAFPKE